MYKAIRSIFILFALCVSTNSFAQSFSDRNFEMSRMLSTNSSILLLSPCEDKDYMTAYTFSGRHLWTISMYTKVISWGNRDGYLYVFSKSRYTDSTYLTCFDIDTGYKVWEHP